jgi:two-component system sensor kinase FixL
MSSGGTNRFIAELLGASRRQIFVYSFAAILVIAWADWYSGYEVTLGALYILPVITLSVVLSRLQIVGVAILCGVLRIVLSYSSSLTDAITDGFFGVMAFGVLGLFAYELVRNRQAIMDAQEQLRLLAESSPAAIFTLDSQGRILSANRATQEMLGLDPRKPLLGQAIGENLPVLGEALKLDGGLGAFRTAAQIHGRRIDGTLFLAQAWFSTYRADDGSARLAAIAVDATEEIREREEQSQLQLLDSNRIIAGAVAHEVRNICGAMSVVYANLERVPGIQENHDYRALGQLVTGLGSLAHLELGTSNRKLADTGPGHADLRDVLNQLRILVGPSWEEQGLVIHWPELQQPDLVAGDAFGLLQACLNLANNSLSAIGDAGTLTITVENTNPVRVSFIDSGPGVANPEVLFQPFRSGSRQVGLGLYISRALLRRDGGDLRYEPSSSGARFVIEIPSYEIPSHEIPVHGVTYDSALTR